MAPNQLPFPNTAPSAQQWHLIPIPATCTPSGLNPTNQVPTKLCRPSSPPFSSSFCTSGWSKNPTTRTLRCHPAHGPCPCSGTSSPSTQNSTPTSPAWLNHTAPSSSSASATSSAL
ncbi:hypothetical protein ACFX13_028817 [Malus domestica]